ncbi:MAG: glycosyltransferase family 2 protein [Nitrospinaceae bacterium]
MNSQTPNISVIVLAYRSAETIASFVESLVHLLEAREPDWEIVLVGNYVQGAGDKTPDVVRALAEKDPRICAVIRVKEGMMGWDMKTGLAAARGRTLAVIDGDGQMPAEDIIRVYQLLKKENLALAKTYRVQRDDGPYRKFISVIYNAIFRMLFPGLNCRDINSKPKILTREAYERLDLKSDGWFIDAEIMIQARREKFKTGEIQTVFHNLDSRPSFVKPSSILEFLANLIWHRLLEFWPGKKNRKKQ